MFMIIYFVIRLFRRGADGASLMECPSVVRGRIMYLSGACCVHPALFRAITWSAGRCNGRIFNMSITQACYLYLIISSCLTACPVEGHVQGLSCTICYLSTCSVLIMRQTTQCIIVLA
jgi:hypothetical protein